jgi:hypothetical protein
MNVGDKLYRLTQSHNPAACDEYEVIRLTSSGYWVQRILYGQRQKKSRWCRNDGHFAATTKEQALADYRHRCISRVKRSIWELTEALKTCEYADALTEDELNECIRETAREHAAWTPRTVYPITFCRLSMLGGC